MTVSIASDFRPIDQGFSEPASSEMPLPQDSGMPMDGADAALSQQAVEPELASEGLDEPVVTEDVLKQLKSQGWADKDDLSKLRSTLDRRVQEEQRAALEAKREAQSALTAYQTVAGWLQQNAEKYGIEESDLKELSYMLRDKADEVQGQFQQTEQQAQANVKTALQHMFSYLQDESVPSDGGDPLFKVDDPRFKPLIDTYARYAYEAERTGDQRYIAATAEARKNFLAEVRRTREQSLMARISGSQQATQPQPQAPAQRRGPQNTSRGGGAAAHDFKSVLESMKKQNPNTPYQDIYADAWAAWERQG